MAWRSYGRSPTSWWLTVAWRVGLALCVLLTQSHVSHTTSSVSQPTRLSVERGRPVFLHPNDLVFDLEEDELCQVEVISHDPSTQRVGQIKPKTFDCLFLPYTVQYIHNGSPLLESDTVTCNVYHGKAGQPVQTDTFQISVEVIEAPYEVIINDPNLRTLEVKEFQGHSKVIDNSVLRFRYNYYTGATCSVSFSQGDTHWPLAGRLVRGDSNRPVQSFRHNCREFLFLGYKYEHLQGPTPETDYIPLRVEVSEPTMGKEPMVEHYYLPVKIDGAFPNNPPKLTVSGSNILEVVENSLTMIDSNFLLAEDRETAPENLLIRVVQPEGMESGYFVRTDDYSQPLRSFYQRDVLDNSIGFLASSAPTDSKVLKVELVAVDQNFDTSPPVTLHVAVQVAQDSKPRVVRNQKLVLREGTHAAISSEHLHVEHPDSSYSIEMQVKGGLRSGHLEVNGRETDVFSVADVESGNVVYFHDGRDATEDKMILRITDGEHNVRVKFYIKVVQEDDSAPSLVRNTGLDVRLGGEVQITPLALSGKDRDSDQGSILYIMKSEPLHGKIVRKLKPLTEGKVVSQFTQSDLERGYIYYRHSGGRTMSDSFEVRLLDNHDPPNKSGKFVVEVAVFPDHHEPPHLARDATLNLTVKETEITVLTSDMLHYLNLHDEDQDIMYTVTSLPFFLTTTITIDAGRLFNTANVSRLAKDAAHLPVMMFTQKDVSEGRIAYMPPLEDVGPIRRSAQFVFAVTDSNGNQLFEQHFDITILPENNQVPHMSLHPIQVWEGGTAVVTPRDLMAYDPDTDQADLVFVIEGEPRYGLLLKGENRMTRGEYFSQEDLSNGIISYIHDGSEVEEDSFGISVSDGMNKFTKVMKVAIEMVSNQEPRPLPGLQNSVTVTEGGELVLSKRNIGATDNDTEDMSLMFMLVKPPLAGEIVVNNRPAKEFSQRDLVHGKVKYVHTEGEIGMASKMDTITFLIMDESLATKKGNRIPLLDLNITIVPVDNAKPELILGEPLLVNEGQKALISFEILSAQDLDTPPEAIGFIVANAPKYGFIENSKRPAGLEKRNAGKTVSSFMLADLKDGSIHYVSNSENALPEEDSFAVYVTDGKQSSPSAKVDVIIVPDQENDLLLFDLDQLIVDEGGQRVFNVHLSENPNPENHWMLSLDKSPRHGELLLAMDSPDLSGMVELPLQEVSMLDMGRNMHLLYKHDGSETTKDVFTIKVSDGTFSATKMAPVIIIPVNDETPQLVVNAELVVNSSSEALITDDVLMAVDTDNLNSEILFVVTALPDHGFIEYRSFNGYNVVPQVPPVASIEWTRLQLNENFTQRQIHERMVRYVHLDENVWADTDSFKFQLTDQVNSQNVNTFNIKVVGGRPHELIILNNGMTVHQGETVRITADQLSANDEGHSREQEIVYTVVREPLYGQLVTPVSKQQLHSFTQHELLSGEVAYMHTSSARFTEDVLGLSVVNNFNYTVSTGFKISIVFLDKSPPSLDKNMALTVEQGDKAVLKASNLHITDPDTATSNLTYIILEGPHNGKLYNRHGPTQFFTQYEIDNDEITYRSESRGDSGLDFFLFTITDNHHENFLINGTRETQPLFFNVLIQPMSKKPPKMVTNRSPATLEFLSKDKYGFVLTSDNLKAEHPLSDPVDIVYSVTDKPQHGYLEHLGTRRPIKKRFLQKDLDDARVAFVLDSNKEVTNDSFTFKVYDRNRNTLDNQKFYLQWSKVEFEQAQYFVCEDAEVLPIVLVRHGDTSISSSVRLKVKGMSAKENQDYRLPESDLIEFAPGDSSVTWNVAINMDREREGNEKFKVMLRRPTNALIGETDKSRVEIVNYEHGRCEEYIGMITKNYQSPMMTGTGFQGGQATENTAGGSSATTGQGPGTSTAGDPSTDLADYGDTFGPLYAYNSYSEYGDPDQDEENYGYDYGEEDEGDSTGDYDPWSMTPMSSYSNGQNGGGGGSSKNGRQQHPLASSRNNDKGGKRRKSGARKKDKSRRRNKQQNRGGGGLGLGSAHGGGAGTFDEHGMTLPGPQQSSGAQANQNNQMLPQSCTPDTRGLLYFDLHSSKMYRCNGFQWEHWGWGTGNVHYANMLQDASSPTSPNQANGAASGITGQGGDFVPLEPKCPDDWREYRESCYYFYSHKLTWSEAEAFCVEKGAHLTEIESVKHQEFLWDMAKQRSFWTGLNDQRVGGVWEYTSEAPVGYFNWRRGFPRAPRFYDANCVLISKRAQWVNRECETRKARYVCSRPLKPRKKRHQHKHRLSWHYEAD